MDKRLDKVGDIDKRLDKVRDMDKCLDKVRDLDQRLDKDKVRVYINVLIKYVILYLFTFEIE